MAVDIVCTLIGCTINSWTIGKTGPAMPETHDCTLTKTYRSGVENAKMIRWGQLCKGIRC